MRHFFISGILCVWRGWYRVGIPRALFPDPPGGWYSVRAVRRKIPRVCACVRAPAGEKVIPPIMERRGRDDFQVWGLPSLSRRALRHRSMCFASLASVSVSARPFVLALWRYRPPPLSSVCVRCGVREGIREEGADAPSLRAVITYQSPVWRTHTDNPSAPRPLRCCSSTADAH